MKHTNTEDYWIPLADLMTGLMMIFLLVAVSYIKTERGILLKLHQDDILLHKKLTAKLTTKSSIADDLSNNFKMKMQLWNATFNPSDLSISFNDPGALFATGSATLTPKFQKILSDFFPQYIQLLSQSSYESQINEIRIEGYTSSAWSTQTTEDDAYFLNMVLSQARTSNVLKYVFLLPSISNLKPFMRSHVTANGLSSSHLIYFPNGTENPSASQRVEFKVTLLN